MNEIRQLCTSSMSPEKHLDEIFELFQTCSSEQTLPSLSLICQSISCMSIEQLHIDILQHEIFLLIRQWCERLLENWFEHQTLTDEEYRSMFYIHQLFKLIAEWFNEQVHEHIEQLIKTLFLDEDFLRILARVIQQLIHTKNESNDILEILYHLMTTFIHLYNQEYLIHQSLVNEYLTNCLFECLTSSITIEFSMKFFHEIPTFRTRFVLFTCLDYLIDSNMSNELFSTIYQIFQIWCDIPNKFNDEISLLIIRFIRYFNQYSFDHRERIIQENLCASLRSNFDLLCQTSTFVDELVSLLINLASIPLGKEHLRQLGFVQLIFDQIKHYLSFWQPFALLLNQQDLYEALFLKRLMHLLIIRTSHICQTLTSTINDTSFDSMPTFSKQQLALNAIDWLSIFRREFLCFTIVSDELIHSTKKIRFIPMLIETILAVEQEDDMPEKLIEIMLEFLWTLTFDIDTKILINHSQFHQWLKENISQSTNIRVISQGILFLLEPIRSNINSRRLSNQLICMITTDESYHDLCVTLRDRLQIEQHYSVELIVTSKCQSIDSLIQLIHRSSLCLFCASKSMKSDNLAHLISTYFTVQSQSIPLVTIRLEHDLEFDGNWLENLPHIDMSSILKEIRRYVTPPTSMNLLKTKRTNSNPSHRHSWNYMQRSVHSWSTQDVNQWCEATQGRFESLRPLVMRLNGPALVHLAEILASEPAAMYHSLNDELLQRTGSTVPLTEYASLCSELQRLIRMKSTNSSFNLHSKKKKWTQTRFCTLF